MSAQRLYRLTVEKWPTPDGQPFDQQSCEFWEAIAYAWHNPAGLAPDDENLWPEWLGDIGEWFDDPGGPWQPPGRAYKPGYYYENVGLVVPILARRHWLSRSGAQRKADVLALWGCTVRIDASDPITWASA